MRVGVLLIAGILLIGGAQGAFAQQDTGKVPEPAGAVNLEVPDDLHQQLQQMRTAAERRFRDGWRSAAAQYQAFNGAAAAAQRVLRPSVARRLSVVEEANPEAKLVTILADRQQRPEVYAEIDERYLHTVANPGARVVHGPSLIPEHATETYRLVWEYLLLRPKYMEFVDVGPIAIQALAVIHNPATLTTAVECFRIATQAPAPIADSEERQEQIIDLLRVFQDTPEGKTAMEQCLHFAEEQRARMTAEDRRRARVFNPDWNASDYAHSRGTQLPTEILSQ